MQSTLTPQDTDPHDAFVIEPDVVLATRQAPDPVKELLSHLAHKAAQKPPEISVIPEAPAVAPPPAVDTTFRAASIDTIDTTDRPVAPDDRPGIGWWVRRGFIAFMFALCSAFAAAAWKHHGDTARQMISSWVPPSVLAASPFADKPAAAESPEAAPVQTAAADPAPAQPTAPAQTPAPSSDAATAAVAAAPAQPSTPSPSTPSPSAPSMARDLATMGQQIEQLKASIEQLKASQAQMSREIAARNSEPGPRPRASAQPPRPVAAIPPRPIPAPHKPPRQAYLPPPPVITSAQPSYAMPPPLPPPASPQSVTSQPVASQPLMSQPAPLSEATTASDDGPVIRPPMPLR
jgi:hypothetical protein